MYLRNIFSQHVWRVIWVLVLQILEPMEETRTQLVMVTEAIFASALDLLNRFEAVPSQRKAARLSELDVKAGLLQVIFAAQDCSRMLHVCSWCFLLRDACLVVKSKARVILLEPR